MRIAPLLFAIIAACAAEDDPVSDSPVPSVHAQSQDAIKAAKTTKSSNVVDHGGLVLPASNTYAIYWGNAADFPSDLQAGMDALLGGLNRTDYLDIATQYMRGASASTTYRGKYYDTSAPPKSAPSTTALAAEVCKLFPAPDPTGVYIVFTSNAPNLNYCAWHNKATCNGVPIEVAYVPNQAQLPGCSPYTATNLGCNSYSDGTVASADSVAHEFMESITDTQINAWYDGTREEIADKCEYNYTECVGLSTGSFQIQAIWSNAVSGCQQQ